MQIQTAADAIFPIPAPAKCLLCILPLGNVHFRVTRGYWWNFLALSGEKDGLHVECYPVRYPRTVLHNCFRASTFKYLPIVADLLFALTVQLETILNAYFSHYKNLRAYFCENFLEYVEKLEKIKIILAREM